MSFRQEARPNLAQRSGDVVYLDDGTSRTGRLSHLARVPLLPPIVCLFIIAAAVRRLLMNIRGS